jgi:hypothetical protein
MPGRVRDWSTLICKAGPVRWQWGFLNRRSTTIYTVSAPGPAASPSIDPLTPGTMRAALGVDNSLKWITAPEPLSFFRYTPALFFSSLDWKQRQGCLTLFKCDNSFSSIHRIQHFD